ncbi:MAG: hydantoinase B/oxoprolinase family protein [Armatimonadota bacterium]|nr:hydantoinase B/oxoprolinase family protein [Armatimonadota bacterium]MDR7459562.1 hydantoinase B/oxoprolinase family protein [Armatimonadota bacterium]MDR7480352.1 hydantoinase B/oxoprolinase family protein [Armatimonadota bacterium]MDR7488301.1 hydantoinase B/oxoprolinase family protein [Armatimonadota bacterium]MDR7491341.1 hydantoinase B/oxoprolinase family protein [Armatimonadota bacterium]
MRETALDPITLEVIWSRLLAVVTEQQDALMRTAFSTVVRESQDLACGLFDPQGRMIAQSVSGTPGHINAMATSMRHFLRAYPPERLAPGDVLLTNDPWMTAGQVNDITVATPVFRGGRLVALFANTCHAPDIGGRLLSAEAREVYEEGLLLPILKLFDRGEPNQVLLAVIRANVRLPDEVVGDLYAQAACNEAGARALLETMEEFGLATLDDVAEEIVRRSEAAVRQRIRALPDGEWTSETWSDGFDEPILIRCRVRVAGDELWIDFTGSSPQSPRGINVVLNYTHAYASFAVKAAIYPDIPHNEGGFRPVHVSAPPGCILHALPPAPVASRHALGHFIPTAIYAALAGALPDRVIAPGADPIWLTVWRGSDPPFTFTMFQVGGTGARPSQDGLNTVGFPSGVAGVPAEVVEALSPLILWKRELRPDSGGPGRWRGGLGQRTTFGCRGRGAWSVSGIVDRTRFPAPGLLGGGPGAPGEVVLDSGERPNPKARIDLRPGQLIHLHLPGGGGYGDPYTRDPERVRQDVAAGYVTPEAAARDYGVVVRFTGDPDALVRLPEEWVVDEAATRELRERRKTERAR